MDWISTEKEYPPVNIWVLVKYKKGFFVKDASYEALKFSTDEEYGYCAPSFENYAYIEDIEKWCIIK